MRCVRCAFRGGFGPCQSEAVCAVPNCPSGRAIGHRFEQRLAGQITLLGAVPLTPRTDSGHLTQGIPAVEILNFIAHDLRLARVDEAKAWWLGGLATAGDGDREIPEIGLSVPRSKSDVVVRLQAAGVQHIVGLGIKTCNKKTPTNAQLYFTTAVAFCALLRRQEIAVSQEAKDALRQFCGDVGHRPLDMVVPVGRRSRDRSRWFWEELPTNARLEWESTLREHQVAVTRALVQFAYADDPVPPTYVVHQRVAAASEVETPLAMYSLEQFLAYSSAHGGFMTRPYRVLKGSNRDPDVEHLAPRFGVVQMQRGGQKKHPTQLQFNLRAGYFRDFPAAPSG